MPAVTRRRALQAGLAAAAATAAPRPSEAQGEARVRLRVLETTDLHVNVFPYDYYRDAADETVGLSRTASLVAKARAEAPNSLLFDNGDLIQGSPLGDFVANRRGMKDGDVHPMIAAMNALPTTPGRSATTSSTTASTSSSAASRRPPSPSSAPMSCSPTAARSRGPG